MPAGQTLPPFLEDLFQQVIFSSLLTGQTLLSFRSTSLFLSLSGGCLPEGQTLIPADGSDSSFLQETLHHQVIGSVFHCQEVLFRKVSLSFLLTGQTLPSFRRLYISRSTSH